MERDKWFFIGLEVLVVYLGVIWVLCFWFIILFKNEFL